MVQGRGSWKGERGRDAGGGTGYDNREGGNRPVLGGFVCCRRLSLLVGCCALAGRRSAGRRGTSALTHRPRPKRPTPTGQGAYSQRVCTRRPNGPSAGARRQQRKTTRADADATARASAPLCHHGASTGEPRARARTAGAGRHRAAPPAAPGPPPPSSHTAPTGARRRRAATLATPTQGGPLEFVRSFPRRPRRPPPPWAPHF